jgi:hypothetical protein
MIVSRLFVPAVAALMLGLLAGACGNSGTAPAADDEQRPAGESTADAPVSSGLVAADTFMTFDGQRYELKDTLQADLTADDFTEVGVASEADIDHDGGLAVYRRAGDDSAVYTLSPASDEEGEEADVPELWLKWEPTVE